VNDLALRYLIGRGLSEDMIAALKIHWISRDDAITERYGYGRQATSPDGLIVFPTELGGDRIISVARNFHNSPESETQHLATINRYRQSKGLEPVKKVGKYILPTGDRSKSRLYDPYRLLNPNTDKPVLFATEDIFGVIKAAVLGYRTVSTFGVWLVTREELENCESNSDWFHSLTGQFPLYVTDSDILTNGAVFQATIRTAYKTLCDKVAAFPSQDRAKVGLDEFIDSGGNLEAIANSGLGVAEFVQQALPQVFDTLETQLPLAQAANKAGQIHTAVIRELARNVTEISTFRLCYGETLKKVGFGVSDWKTIYQSVKPNRSLTESPRLLAQALIAGELKDAIAFESKLKVWYLYESVTAHWQQVQKESISALIDRSIEKVTGTKDFDRNLIKDAIEFVRDGVEVREWQAAPKLLNFRNGTLDLCSQIPLLLNHSPRHYLRYCLPRDYTNGSATGTPNIDQFQRELTGDQETEIEKLNCFAAAVLRGLIELQVYLALIGDPGSGKGTWVNFLIELLGHFASYSTNLESFCGNQFDAGNCYGKRLIVFNDCDQYNGGISKFLNFTGGDYVRGEIKGGASFNFKAEGFILLTANKPVFVRSHPGLARRTALVNCVKPRNRKTDTALLPRLCTELEPYTSKLLQIPVERIREVLLDRGVRNPQETVNYWQHLCEVDAIAAWADESLTLSPNAEAIIGKDRSNTSELFGHYSQFCQRSGKTPKAFNVFSADLLTLLKDTVGLPVERVRRRSVAGEPTVLVGIRLKQAQNESGIFLYLSEVMPVMPSALSNGSGHAVSSAKVLPNGISLAERHNNGKASGMTDPLINQGRHNWHDSGGVKNISELNGEVIVDADDF
jgi:phage/plasmid-associated DNA primase